MMTEIIRIGQQFCVFLPGWGCGARTALSALPHLSHVETASRFLLGLVAFFLAHRFAFELDTISIVNDAIQDTVGDRWIANLFVPVRHGNLRSQNQRPTLITVIADLQKIATLSVFA